MVMVILFKEIPQSLVEFFWSVKMPSGKDMSSDMFPQPLNYVEVRGIWGKNTLVIDGVESEPL